MPDPFPSLCFTPPPTTPYSLLLTGVRRNPCATPPGGMLFGHPAESSPHTCYEPKTCIDASSEQSPPRGETASTSRMTLPPQSQPLRTPTVFISKRQPAEARSPSVPASVVNPWLGADMWSSTRKLVRGTTSSASVDGLCREEKEIEIWKVYKLCLKRRILHVYLEQKAELAVQGEMRSSENIDCLRLKQT